MTRLILLSEIKSLVIKQLLSTISVIFTNCLNSLDMFQVSVRFVFLLLDLVSHF